MASRQLPHCCCWSAAQVARLALAAQRSSGIAITSGTSSTSRSGSSSDSSSKSYPKRQRLDDYCLQQNPQHSKNLIQSWIVQGKVLVNDKVVTKAGHAVPKNANVRILAEDPKFVCRAGFKLEKALDHFEIDVTGLTALDAGLSTGGFTDCLVQRGARHVYGVDVGHGQVMGSIAQDPRVTVMEKTNLRHMAASDVPEQVSLVTLDLSFISVLKVMPAVAQLVAPGAQLVVLVKPQFEAGRSQVGSGGVVKDPKVHQQVIDRITKGVEAYGFVCRGVTESPLKGDKGGNTEFLAHFVHDPSQGPISIPPDGMRDEGGDVIRSSGLGSSSSSSNTSSSGSSSSSSSAVPP
uniref:RNA-binding S4 domain-containing protein n=1 Tax=Tetradesmus obliquus TaxID=3088 RepID=A0A383W5Y5_TETOB|eukprot:jgi/Sobl393_1/10146/SZX79482.1